MLHWRSICLRGKAAWRILPWPTLCCWSWRILGLLCLRYPFANLLENWVLRWTVPQRPTWRFPNSYSRILRPPNPDCSISLQHFHNCWLQLDGCDDYEVRVSCLKINYWHLQNSNYLVRVPCSWERKILSWKAFRFFLLVLGTLVYNEIIEIPLTFMYRNTKRNLIKRE